MNTAEFLSIPAAIVPDREAMVSGEQRLTYMEVQERVNCLAAALMNLGLEKGGKVAVMAMNCPQYVETYYACSKIGVAFVPLNYRAKQEELVYMMNTAEASVLFAGERYLPLVDAIKGG